MVFFLLVLQIIISILLIVLILFQQRGTALGGVFGGSGESYFKKRHFEKIIFWSTIVVACLFVICSLLNLIF